VYAERSAFLKFDKVRAHVRADQAEQAKKALEDLVRAYPGTVAAAGAQELLKTMN
jgi:TolA-binding protein